MRTHMSTELNKRARVLTGEVLLSATHTGKHTVAKLFKYLERYEAQLLLCVPPG